MATAECTLVLFVLQLVTTWHAEKILSSGAFSYTAVKLQCVSKKTSPTFFAVTLESIVGFS